MGLGSCGILILVHRPMRISLPLLINFLCHFVSGKRLAHSIFIVLTLIRINCYLSTLWQERWTCNLCLSLMEEDLLLRSIMWRSLNHIICMWLNLSTIHKRQRTLMAQFVVATFKWVPNVDDKVLCTNWITTGIMINQLPMSLLRILRVNQTKWVFLRWIRALLSRLVKVLWLRGLESACHRVLRIIPILEGLIILCLYLNIGLLLVLAGNFEIS